MIKKILFGFALLASVASCTDDYTDWAQPQANPQQDAVTFGDGSVAPVALIDFANIPDGQEMVQVCTITAPTASDEAYVPEYKITLGDNTYDITANGEMSVSDLENYVISTFGRRPSEREMDATINTWVNNGATTVKLTSGAFKITAKPEAPYISQNYYIIGEPSAWNPTETSLKFVHSGADVYDDPVFTITIPVASAVDDNPDKMWFAITDDVTLASGDWNDVLGCAEGNGNNSEEGKIARRTEIGNDGSFVIDVDGTAKFIKITLNMMDYTYKIEKLNFGAFFYEIGNDSGWATSNPLYGANFDGKYQGYYYLNGEFKFKPNADNWDGDYEFDGEGKIADNGGSNCPDPGAGFYQIDVDLVAGTYALTKVETISAIGDFNSWGGDVDLTYNTESGAWEASGVALSGGVKFRMNHEWAISWGGNGSGDNFDNLTSNNGANLNVAEGTYDIQLFISYEGNNRVVFTKK